MRVKNSTSQRHFNLPQSQLNSGPKCQDKLPVGLNLITRIRPNLFVNLWSRQLWAFGNFVSACNFVFINFVMTFPDLNSRPSTRNFLKKKVTLRYDDHVALCIFVCIYLNPKIPFKQCAIVHIHTKKDRSILKIHGICQKAQKVKTSLAWQLSALNSYQFYVIQIAMDTKQNQMNFIVS